MIWSLNFCPHSRLCYCDKHKHLWSTFYWYRLYIIYFRLLLVLLCQKNIQHRFQYFSYFCYLVIFLTYPVYEKKNNTDVFKEWKVILTLNIFGYFYHFRTLNWLPKVFVICLNKLKMHVFLEFQLLLLLIDFSKLIV